MNRLRHSRSGVTLIEMLVVLALFAVLAGAVVLALPGERKSLRADVDAQALISALNRAVDQTLLTGKGFGILHEDGVLRFVQRQADGGWQPHADPVLSQVKLFPKSTRISEDKGQVFAVSAALVPNRSTLFAASFGGGPGRLTVTFDGVRARVTTNGAD